MKTKLFKASVKTVVFMAALAAVPVAGLNARTVVMVQTMGAVQPGEFTVVAFSDSAEAGMLHRAYAILATGDHDYKGHRVKAMHAVEAAAKLLGVDLKGDAKDKQPQPLSDEKLREARGLIGQVMESAAVKDQKKVTKHLNEAFKEIDTALSVK
jgi:hypothetical protein